MSCQIIWVCEHKCWHIDILHLVIEHFQWPQHRPGMLCRCLSELLNSLCSGNRQKLLLQASLVMTEHDCASCYCCCDCRHVICDIAVCTVHLQHFCDSVLISACIIIIIIYHDRSIDWRTRKRRRSCLDVDQDKGKRWITPMLSLKSNGYG